MTPVQALILGLIQGLTEFLPISSSGHLVIVQTYFGISEPPLFFDILIHLATLGSVLVFFRHRLANLNFHLAKLLVYATIPAAIFGYLIRPYLTEIYSSLLVVALGLSLTGALLIMITYPKRNLSLDKLSPSKALLIGLLQAVALVPGVSRSAATVFASLKSGLAKTDAFYFSFLLAIPTITAASLLLAIEKDTLSQAINFSSLIGFTAAAISGFFALKLLEIVIRQLKLHYFAYYCFTLSALILITQIG